MFEDYNPYAFNQETTSIVIILFTLIILCFVYYNKLKKQKITDTPSSFVLVVQLYIDFIRNLVVSIFGQKGEKYTPYFLFLFIYLAMCNLMSIFGFSSPTSSLSTTLSLALLTFFGTIAIGFKYQKLSYLKTFCLCIKVKGKQIPIIVNPFNIISLCTPLISLSCRL
jgi:F-type H+-transporting ATPase subunit a